MCSAALQYKTALSERWLVSHELFHSVSQGA